MTAAVPGWTHDADEETGGAPRSSRLRTLHFDVAARPFLVLFELTRACALACAHCRAEAGGDGDPDELSTAEAVAVLEDLASLGAPRPHIVFSGGDPLRRRDLDHLVATAAAAGLAVGVSPAGTPLATAPRLAALRHAGARTVSFSLDGGDAPSHDGFRRVAGSFAWTLAGCRAAQDAGLRLQVNTTVSAETVDELPAVLRLVHEMGANLWSVFFLVPTGRGRALAGLDAAETEDVLFFLDDVAEIQPLKTTEAPAYRRVVRAGRSARAVPGALYHHLHGRLGEVWPEGAWLAGTARRGSHVPDPRRRRAPLAVGDARGVVFVSHTGDVQPSGFLPLVVGNVRTTPLTRLYREAPLLRALRDAARLGGRCGRCAHRETCGGSRAQAFARGGNPLGEDPTCPYDPPAAEVVSAATS